MRHSIFLMNLKKALGCSYVHGLEWVWVEVPVPTKFLQPHYRSNIASITSVSLNYPIIVVNSAC